MPWRATNPVSGDKLAAAVIEEKSMKLLLVRHAIAEEAGVFVAAGGSDAQRPLTEIGRKKMR